MTTTTSRLGGRGAKERILRVATELFYRQGINSTGIEQLASAAHVSKRTLYQHFASKDDLITAYVRGLSQQRSKGPVRTLDRTETPARERLLAIFDVTGSERPPTGCPFLKTAAEIADPRHPARVVTRQAKQDFIAALVRLAREAGADDPDALGHQIALLFDGAQSQGVATDSREPFEYARSLARTLVDRAIDGR